MDYLNSSRKTFLSDYEHNPLLRLVFFCGIGYVLLHLVKIVVFMWQQVALPDSTAYFYDKIYLHFAIQPLAGMHKHPWTLITFMFTGLSFMKVVSTLVWLFVFGNVIQKLVGKSEVFPLFLLSNIVGGIVFIALLNVFPMPYPLNMFSGADAAVMAFGIGALTGAPKYKIAISSILSIPLWGLVLIYIGLNVIVLFQSNNYAYFGLLLAGAVTGSLYMVVAKSGYKLGALGNRVWAWAAHKTEAKKKIGDRPFEHASHDVNAILDKINADGIQSLNNHERKILEQFQ